MIYYTPAVTYALIVANILVSGYALYGDRNFVNQFAFNVGAVVKGEQHYRVITSGFLHADLFHLIFNMVTLYFFGPPIEGALGKLGFIVLYFGSMIASGITSAIVHRRNPGYSAIGASGAVSGVVLSFCVFAPLQPIYFFMLPIGIPALLYGFIFIVISARQMGDGSRIAHEGHLGGAVAGVILTILMRPDAITRFFG